MAAADFDESKVKRQGGQFSATAGDGADTAPTPQQVADATFAATQARSARIAAANAKAGSARAKAALARRASIDAKRKGSQATRDAAKAKIKESRGKAAAGREAAGKKRREKIETSRAAAGAKRKAELVSIRAASLRNKIARAKASIAKLDDLKVEIELIVQKGGPGSGPRKGSGSGKTLGLAETVAFRPGPAGKPPAGNRQRWRMPAKMPAPKSPAKTKAKLNIDEAAAKLKVRGLTLGKPLPWKPGDKDTTYAVHSAGGKVQHKTGSEIAAMVARPAAAKTKSPPAKAKLNHSVDASATPKPAKSKGITGEAAHLRLEALGYRRVGHVTGSTGRKQVTYHHPGGKKVTIGVHRGRVTDVDTYKALLGIKIDNAISLPGLMTLAANLTAIEKAKTDWLSELEAEAGEVTKAMSANSATAGGVLVGLPGQPASPPATLPPTLENPYLGLCPECGAPGIEREKKPYGNDKCINGHIYPTHESTKTNLFAATRGMLAGLTKGGPGSGPRPGGGSGPRQISPEAKAKLQAAFPGKGGTLDAKKPSSSPREKLEDDGPPEINPFGSGKQRFGIGAGGQGQAAEGKTLLAEEASRRAITYGPGEHTPAINSAIGALNAAKSHKAAHIAHLGMAAAHTAAARIAHDRETGNFAAFPHTAAASEHIMAARFHEKASKAQLRDKSKDVGKSMDIENESAGEIDLESIEEVAELTATCEFTKAEEKPDHSFVLGPVLVPEAIDKQGDIVSEEEIEKTAHNYMADSQRPGLMHQLMLGTRHAQVVESYITRSDIAGEGDRVIAKGTWMVGMRIYDEKLREMIRSGKLKGYSIGGHGARTPEANPELVSAA